MIYFLYRYWKVKTGKMAYIQFQRLNSTLCWNFAPHVLIYITYRDLKFKIGEMAFH